LNKVARTDNPPPDEPIEVPPLVAGGAISDVFNLLKRDRSETLSIEVMTDIAAESWAGKR
jgi:hypothetical protein